MDFSEFSSWMLASIGEHQLDVNDKREAREELRRYYEEKYRGRTRRGRERLESELHHVARMEDYHLSGEFIRTFQPRVDVPDDLWRRCDQVYWKYRAIERLSKDDFFKMLKLVKYVSISEQAEPGRDYEALWEAIKHDWIAE